MIRLIEMVNLVNFIFYSITYDFEFLFFLRRFLSSYQILYLLLVKVQLLLNNKNFLKNTSLNIF